MAGQWFAAKKSKADNNITRGGSDGVKSLHSAPKSMLGESDAQNPLPSRHHVAVLEGARGIFSLVVEGAPRWGRMGFFLNFKVASSFWVNSSEMEFPKL